MKIYDTNYGPDTFGRIRTGLITEMFLTFDGFMRPDVGDQLRINCMFKGVVRDVYTVLIAQVCDCIDEPETVLISVSAPMPINKGHESNLFPEFFSDAHLRLH